MPRNRRLKNIRRKGPGWQAYVRVNGRLHTKQYPIDTPVDEMRTWADEQVDTFGGAVPTAGSFAADIETYLARVTALPTIDQRTAHLALWQAALGGDRARRTITPAEIDQVFQDWLRTLSAATVRKRRTALQSLFVTLDGKQAKNPVKATANPQAPKPEARGLDYLTIERLLAAMPDSLTKIRVTVLAYTGLPPGQLQTVTPTDLQLTAGTVRVLARRKGRGAAPSTRPLTVEGLAAFQAFHAATAYGAFAIESVNRSFKRAAKRIGLDPAAVHLYDLRYSFGMEMYRVSRDIETVARFGHAPGSVVTARYAQGANAAVDTSAAAAFSAALATQRQQALKAAAGRTAGQQLPAKVARRAKVRSIKHLRRRA